MEFSKISSEQDLIKLDEYLADKSYVDGATFTSKDVTLAEQVKSLPTMRFQNVTRWFKHVTTLQAATGQTKTLSSTLANCQVNNNSGDNLERQVKEQGDLIRKLKSAKVPKEQITQEVNKLLELKAQLGDAAGGGQTVLKTAKGARDFTAQKEGEKSGKNILKTAKGTRDYTP